MYEVSKHLAAVSIAFAAGIAQAESPNPNNSNDNPNAQGATANDKPPAVKNNARINEGVGKSSGRAAPDNESADTGYGSTNRTRNGTSGANLPPKPESTSGSRATDTKPSSSRGKGNGTGAPTTDQSMEPSSNGSKLSRPLGDPAQRP